MIELQTGQTPSGAGGAAGSEPGPITPPPPSKTPAPPLMGRAPRPGAVRIRKPVVQAGVVLAALLVSGSLAWAFIVQPELKARAVDAATSEQLGEARASVRPSDIVTGQPASYDRLPVVSSTLPEPRGGALEEIAGVPEAQTPAPSPSYARQRERRPVDQAAESSLFFPNAAVTPVAAPRAAEGAEATPTASGRDHEAIYSPHQLLAPISPYELKAGAMIPGVLLTALDTARPGPVVATVTQNVFDSVTGRHLVIPQGTRLIGRHLGEGVHGDRRAYLVWNRLILPNGKSLILAEEPGVDAQGAVGVRGQVDRRLWPLGVASLFAGAITTLGELARAGSDDRSVVASAGDAASIEAAEVGGRLIDRELGVRPSIRVRAGAPVRVMITRDLILEPYRP
ncbi:TrbI/VirB10 family protein [Brevundimonas sp. PAMC22021]|uniref:TrbI/VirB10 family protein n=1 Tax=Brevundimonas sp. PAMC22021 TaxID=2861285 RepID=UPI001C625D32|nr:TrbI/VirB10 family protein [Brevundimonas sp. PAMC22021]QYF87046.1 TrbI/VirB10 family protein [Brevundimonas sp. PAMC22021]